MTFKVSAVTLGAADTTVFETPAGVEGAMHGLVLTNPTGAPVALSLKFFDASANSTTTLLSGYSLAAGSQFTWPKPINLNGGDKVIASGNGLVALQSTFISEATIAKSFTHRGVHVAGNSYATNDVVSLNGSSYVSLVENNTSVPPGAGWGLHASKGETGVSVSSITRTSGTGAPGTTDTYTIALSNNATASITVYNGANGADGVDGEVTLNTAQTLTNKTFTGYTETVYNLTGTELLEANGSVQIKTLTANTTFTDALASGQSVVLGIDDGTAAYTVTWPTITWTTTPAVAPTLPTTGYLWVVLWKVGATLYGKY